MHRQSISLPAPPSSTCQPKTSSTIRFPPAAISSQKQIASESFIPQAPHARFNTLASSRLASQPDSIIAASSACEVQYPRLESPGFSARLHYSGKLRMRGSVPSPRVAWLPIPVPLKQHAPSTRLKGLQPLAI
ncbi:unnamed protein product [Lactuca virosa]|uniref:Uncharacterized protein n=1 Tax=Lactuca virosa TaxID=75947 RepID=A0AAU9MXH9_9ASTR|nr:unnamed protein product [Lactuca virosa]